MFLMMCEDGHDAITYSVNTYAQKCPICALHEEIAESTEVQKTLVQDYTNLNDLYKQAGEYIEKLTDNLDEANETIYDHIAINEALHRDLDEVHAELAALRKDVGL